MAADLGDFGADAMVDGGEHRRHGREDAEVTKHVSVERLGEELLEREVRRCRAEGGEVGVERRCLARRAAEKAHLLRVGVNTAVAVEERPLRLLHL